MMRHLEHIAGIVGLLSLASVLIVVFRFDPWGATGAVKILFFASLFCAVWGAGTYGFSFIRPRNFFHACRRGVIMAITALLLVGLARRTELSGVGLAIIAAGSIGLEALITYVIAHTTYYDDFS